MLPAKYARMFSDFSPAEPWDWDLRLIEIQIVGAIRNGLTTLTVPGMSDSTIQILQEAGYTVIDNKINW